MKYESVFYYSEFQNKLLVVHPDGIVQFLFLHEDYSDDWMLSKWSCASAEDAMALIATYGTGYEWIGEIV